MLITVGLNSYEILKIKQNKSLIHEKEISVSDFRIFISESTASSLAFHNINALSAK